MSAPNGQLTQRLQANPRFMHEHQVRSILLHPMQHTSTWATASAVAAASIRAASSA